MKKIIYLVIMIGLHISFVSAQEPEQKFQGFNLEGFTEDGEKSWDVTGDTADIEGSKVKISNVVANTYEDEKVNVTAETGTVDQVSGEMHLEKDVVITSEDGMQMQTDSLDWNRNEDLVTTEDDVLITNERMAVTGKGMEAKPGLKKAKIQEDVTVRVDTQEDPKDSKIMTITCDGPMVLDQAKLSASFDENVVAIQGDRTLKADKCDLYFNEGMDDIKEMVCVGNVRVSQGDNRTFAQKAVYRAGDQRVTLTGRPKLQFITEGEGAITAFGD